MSITMKIFIAVVLSAALCVPALGAVDLVNGSAQQSNIRIGLYHPTGSGTQDYVRQYDGRTLSFGSIESLNVLGYDGPWQYSAIGKYLLAHDDDAAFQAHFRNLFGVSFSQSMLTHRLGRTPASDPALVGTPAEGGADFLDLSPDAAFSIDRNVTNINLSATPLGSQQLRLVANSWEQTKDGTTQRLFRAREAKAGVIANRQKGSVALPVDSDTSVSTLGSDMRIGNSVVNYRYSDTKFGEGGTGITAGSDLDFLPLNSLTQVNSDTKSSVVKVRSSVGKNLFFTGAQTNRKRNNTRASLTNPTGQSIGSTNAALSYIATDALTLTAKYRRYDQDSEVAPVLSGGLPTNMSLSNETTSSLVEATYSGVPHTFMKLGFERRDTSRTTMNGDPTFPIIELSTKSNIITSGIRCYPTQNLSFSADATFANADNAGYTGVPDDQTKINANATYMLRDNLALYGDYNKLNERNSQIRVPWSSIPASATNATEEELREEAAGQGYRNEMTTTVLGAWYAFSPKLVWDANYSTVRTNAATTWILGTDPAYLPHIAPDLVPYESLNNQWATGLTYSVTPKSRVYGRFTLSKSDGRSVIDPAAFPDNIGPTWTPVSVREQRYTIGFAHDLSIKDSVSLDYSFSDWKDAIDPSNDGIYDIWRLAWSHQF